MTNQDEIDRLCYDYYKDYYSNQLGLPDWEVKANNRINEVPLISAPLIRNIELLMNIEFKDVDRILIVGGGTGGEFLSLSLKGCVVYAVEPSETAVKIAQLKSMQLGIDGGYRFIRGAGENLPYRDNLFDYVISFTVLEHTRDEEKCIKEMVRVLKPEGRIFFSMPDYRQFYEGHYKITFPIPLISPISLLKLYLYLQGRPVRFIDTINRLSANRIRKFLKDLPVIAMRIYLPYPDEYKRNKSLSMKMRYLFDKRLGIETNQSWILIKRID